MHFFVVILQILIVPAASPLGIGIIKKIKARLQNRQGAPVFQPYKNLWKLLNKDEVHSADASWIFKFAPYVVFTVTLVIGACIPIIAAFPRHAIPADMLVVVYTLAIGTFFLALAGMDTGSAFGGFGASREMTLSALAEGGFVFSLLTLALICKTTDLFGISSAIMTGYSSSFLPILLAFSGFFIVLLSETTRFPFDNPSTHLELTMIHEAMIVEYSGKSLALMEWTSANKLMIFVVLGANLFFPWGIATNASIGSILIGIAAFCAKALVFYTAIALVESSIAKFRFFRLPDLLLISFILNVIAIGMVKLV